MCWVDDTVIAKLEMYRSKCHATANSFQFFREMKGEYRISPSVERQMRLKKTRPMVDGR